jgi:protein TonB
MAIGVARRDRRQLALGMGVAVGVHALLLAVAARPRPSSPATASVAVVLSRLEWHQPPPPRPPERAQDVPRSRDRLSTRAFQGSPRALPALSAHASAAPEGVAASEPTPGPIVDFTGGVSVTGSATSPLGGNVSSSGGDAPASGQPTGAAGGARGVSLDDRSWSCPWPRQADADQIDEQTVVIRVLVDTDGQTQSVQIVADPGHGFGEAARTCALRARFTPARDLHGEPVRAMSPPIAVRFIR